MPSAVGHPHSDGVDAVWPDPHRCAEYGVDVRTLGGVHELVCAVEVACVGQCDRRHAHLTGTLRQLGGRHRTVEHGVLGAIGEMDEGHGIARLERLEKGNA